MNGSKHRQLITLLIMSLLVAGTSGCGPGKKGKNRAKISGIDVPQAKTDGEVADETVTEPTAEEKAAEAARLAAEEKLTAELTALEDAQKNIIATGEQISVKELPDGQYALTSVTTAFNYTSGTSEESADERLITTDSAAVEAKLDDKKQLVSVALKASDQDKSAGIMTDETDTERKLDLPVGFTVDSKGDLISREASRAVNTLLSTKSNGKGNDDLLAEVLGGDDKLKASVIGILMTGEASEDEGGKAVLKVKDENDKVISLRLIKVDDGNFIVYVSIDELLATDGAIKIRNIYLTYKRTNGSSATP